MSHSSSSSSKNNNNNDNGSSNIEDTLTDQVLQQINATNPRTQMLLTKLVQYLHAFCKDVKPTEEEWAIGIDFLTRTGQTSDEKRKEFILLSDVLGVTMLVDTINHKQQQESSIINNDNNNNNPMEEDGGGGGGVGTATETTVEGPFHIPSNSMEMGDHLAKGPERDRGKLTLVHGIVTDSITGKPIPNVTLDVWQSDDLGKYDVQQQQQDNDNNNNSPQQQQQPSLSLSETTSLSTTTTTTTNNTTTTTNLRGTFTTGIDGQYWFYTIQPSSYPVPTDGPVGELLHASGRHPMRPAHIHFMVHDTSGEYNKLTTHIFVKDDPYLDSDAVFGVKESLIVDFSKTTTATMPQPIRTSSKKRKKDDDEESSSLNKTDTNGMIHHHVVEFDIRLSRRTKETS